MRILFPVMQAKGKASEISMHFGKAPYFAVYDTEKDEIEFVENEILHFHDKMRRPVELLLKLKPDVVFVKMIGPKALEVFKSHGIKVMSGEYKTVGEAIENFEKWWLYG